MPAYTLSAAQERLGWLVRRPRLVVVMLWCYVAAYAVWVGFMVAGAVPRGTANDLAFSPLYALAAIGAFLGHLRHGRVTRVARGLLLVAWAWLGSGVAFILWTVNAVLGWGTIDVTAWMLYNMYYPLTLAGLWYLAEFPRARLARTRLALDSLIVVVAAVTLQWYFIIRFDRTSQTAAEIASRFGLLFPGELLIAFGAAVLAHRETRRGDATWPTTLGMGMFLSAVADFVYEHQTLSASTWSGPTGDLLLAIGAALIATAGLRMRSPNDETSVERRPAVLVGRTLLPYLAIALVAVLLTTEFARGRSEGPIGGLVLGGGGLMALLIGRLLVAQREFSEEAEARAAQDARFRSLVLRSSDASLIVDSGGVLRYASPAFSTMAGLGTDSGDERALAEFIGAEPVRRLLDAATTPPGRPERWQLGPASAPRDVEATFTDLRSDPAVGGIVVNLKDVTERSRLEGELRQAQKLEIAGRLSSSIAHDFNNVLTVVIGNIRLAQQAEGSSIAEELNTASEAAVRGAALARQLLSLSRPKPSNPRPMDLCDEVKRIEKTLRSVLPSSIEIRITRPSEPIPVLMDEVQAERILLNLALNARDAMPTGGTLRIDISRAAPPSVAEASDAGTDAWACVSVSDAGHGMDAETMGRALEPFFTTKSLGLGAGLGLSTVESIAHDLGGRVTIVSHPNVGTTVSVLIPVIAGPIPTRAEPRRLVATGRGHVLVVDDEFSVRRVVARYLSNVGFTVSEARDGVDALEVLEESGWRVDAVLTDLVMPRLGGEGLARRIRDHDARLPVLCMSGTSGTPGVTAVPWAADLVLPKPLELEVVAARIADVIGRAA